MTDIVQVQYMNATFTANTATITIGNGELNITNNEAISFEGSFPFSSLNVSSDTVRFYNQSPNTAVNGNATLPIASSGTGDPTITANNFSGSVELQWSTRNGPQHQQLSPGEAVTLTGFTG